MISQPNDKTEIKKDAYSEFWKMTDTNSGRFHLSDIEKLSDASDAYNEFMMQIDK